MKPANNVCAVCGKKYVTLGRFKNHVATAHNEDKEAYVLEKEHLKELVDNAVKKIIENNCYSDGIRKELSSPFISETSLISSFMSKTKGNKYLKKGKLEKFYSEFYAKVVLNNEKMFP